MLILLNNLNLKYKIYSLKLDSTLFYCNPPVVAVQETIKEIGNRNEWELLKKEAIGIWSIIDSHK